MTATLATCTREPGISFERKPMENRHSIVSVFSARIAGPLLALQLAACAAEDAPSEEYFAGERSAALGSATNLADCATCHASTPGAAGFSGDSLADIAYRSSYKGGAAPTLLDAVNACVAGWMGGEALAADDPAWTSLSGFLTSISDPAVTAPNTLIPEVLADVAAYELAYAGGDAGGGEAVYARSCARCHDPGLTVGGAPAPKRGVLASYSVGRIAQQVRTSGPPPSGSAEMTDSTPGPMPFFEPDELSADDLRDVIAFLRAQP